MERKLKERFLLAILCILFGFWGIMYPEYLFSEETVVIKNEAGKILTGSEREELGNIYLRLCEAGADRIKIKSRLLEWLGVGE